ncbi:MAG TPA: DUF742 domain-containing protein [Pseudonocardiaceae bacterium]
MTTGPDYGDDRHAYRDNYRDWADGGYGHREPAGYADPGYESSGDHALYRDTVGEERGAGGLPNPASMEGYGGGLFGGPGADLFGTSVPDYPPASREPEQSWSPPPPPEPAEESGSLVRPYTRTRGRTRPSADLPIEALVSTSERGLERDAALLPEHRSIVGLCTETRSVAEIAAHLRLPLGVVRVLIGDMASLGLVMIHQSGLVMGDRPSLAFLERVLSGLRRL